jgi:hypothetical protein
MNMSATKTKPQHLKKSKQHHDGPEFHKAETGTPTECLMIWGAYFIQVKDVVIFAVLNTAVTTSQAVQERISKCNKLTMGDSLAHIRQCCSADSLTCVHLKQV